MMTRSLPSPAAQRSRAAAVSALLRKAGHRPMPSGSTRQGLIRVSSDLFDVTIAVDTTLHPARITDGLVQELQATLVDGGYLIETVTRDELFTRVRVRKESW